MKLKIAILTPTYNRVRLLSRLYKSLCEQKLERFVWIIVDDGSTDATEQEVEQWAKINNIFEIRYLKLKNGGKSRALNHAFAKNPDIDFFAIVDSDDCVLPEAIGKIKEKVYLYKDNYKVGAIFFRYINPDGTLLQKKKGKIPETDVILNRYEYDAIYSKDDGCIGYYRRVIDEFQFPEFYNENYVGPTVLQMIMAPKYSIAFSNQIIGIAEYQEGGLSKAGRKLRVQNPLGMICYCGLLHSKFNPNFVDRFKYAIAAQAYRHIGGVKWKEITAVGLEKRYLKKWAAIPGALLGIWWNRS